jgi:membrane-bound lytic murein transglycosylase A
MMALDTGTAIVGPARGDIFTGSGFEAGELAGNVRNAADFYIFVPRSVAARFGHGEG